MTTTPPAGRQPTKAFTQLLDDHVARGHLRALGVDPRTAPPDVAGRLVLPAALGGAGLPSADVRQDLTTVQSTPGTLCGRRCEVRTALLAELQAATDAELGDDGTATRMLHRLEHLGIHIHRAATPSTSSSTSFTNHVLDDAMATLLTPTPGTLPRAPSTREARSSPTTLRPADPTGLWSPRAAVASGSTLPGTSPWVHASDFWQSRLKHGRGGVHLVAAVDRRAVDFVVDLTSREVLRRRGFDPGSKACRLAASDREVLFKADVLLSAPTQADGPAAAPLAGRRPDVAAVPLDVSRLSRGRDPAAPDPGRGVFDSLSTTSLVRLASWASHVVQTHRRRHDDPAVPREERSNQTHARPHAAAFRRRGTAQPQPCNQPTLQACMRHSSHLSLLN